jgi:chaperone required for assembly of F1-ATPase
MTGGGRDRDGEERQSNGVPKDSLGPPLKKRFYAKADVLEEDGVFSVTLDGRGIRTPAMRALAVPSRALAEALAAEWEAQGAAIDPGTMPLTRLLNSAIDGVADRRREVVDDLVAFAGSDLLCYRAEAPAGLVRRQSEAWDPILAWAVASLSAPMRTSIGLMPIEQPAQSLSAVAHALDGLDALTLAALHVLTTISGSALIALAHHGGAIGLDDAWRAARVDETWQSEQWGLDAEAEAYAARRFAGFAAASRCLRLLNSRR